MAGNKIHGDKPFAKGYLGIFEDCTYEYGEYFVAIVAFIPDAIGELIAMNGAAVRADDIFTETGLFEVLSANIFGMKIIDQFKK